MHVASAESRIIRRHEASQENLLDEYRKRFTNYRWVHVEEDLGAWRDRVEQALEQLAPSRTTGATGGGKEGTFLAGGGSDPPEGNDLDISVADVRLPLDTEVAEDTIQAQLRVDGFCEDGQIAPSAAAPTEAAGADAKPLAERPVPKMPSFAGIRAKRMSRADTATARLVQSHGLSNLFRKANHINVSRFYVYRNALDGNPHKRWIERVSARCSGQICTDENADRECQAPDLSRIPAELPQVRAGEVILTVAVCNTLGFREQEFDVLSSQHLYELRDAFHFVSDWMFDGPSRMKSACFFIDGIFYIDKRDESAIDYSEALIPWLQNKRGPDFLRADKPRSMNVKFGDLVRIPFGEPCIYIHQGDIEHRLYFTGARLFHPNNDCPLVEAYPVLTFMRRYVKRRCYACWQNPAMWLVLNSTRCPHNPSFWCGTCFRHFFQDAKGEFLPPVDYLVFPYLHDDF